MPVSRSTQTYRSKLTPTSLSDQTSLDSHSLSACELHADFIRSLSQELAQDLGGGSTSNVISFLPFSETVTVRPEVAKSAYSAGIMATSIGMPLPS